MEPGVWTLIWESGVLLPLAALAVMGARWWAAGRGPDPGAVVVRYEPPDDLTPADVGVLADGTAKMRHLTATLLDLEARGHVEIEEVEPRPDAQEDRDFSIRPRTGPPAWEELALHERRVLHTLFSDADDWSPDARGLERITLSLCGELRGRDEVRMSELSDLSWILVGAAGFTRRVTDRGYFPRWPGTVRLRWAGAALLVLLLGAGPAATVLQHVSVAVAALVVGGVGWHMPRRTREGARAAERVAGFRKFLDRVEGDRLRERVSGPEEFDRHLAYAAALDVENEWVPAFHRIYGRRVQEVDPDAETAWELRDGDAAGDLPGAMMKALFSREAWGGGEPDPGDADPTGGPAGTASDPDEEEGAA